MPRSSSGDRSWIENQYVMVNMYLKQVKKKEYSPPTGALEPMGTLVVILCTLQYGPATPLSTRDH